MENINFRNNLSPVSLLLGRLLCPAHGRKSPEALTLITGRQFEDGPVVEWHRQSLSERERGYTLEIEEWVSSRQTWARRLGLCLIDSC